MYTVLSDLQEINEIGRLRRLRDQRPDLHALVMAEELSAHRAMIEAGFRSRTFTVPDDIDAQQRH